MFKALDHLSLTTYLEMNTTNWPLSRRLIAFHQGSFSRQKLEEARREASSKWCKTWTSTLHLNNVVIGQTARTEPGRVCHWRKSPDLIYFCPWAYGLYAVSEAAQPLTWSAAPLLPRHRGDPALVSVPNLPSDTESSSNRDLLISTNFWDRTMDWEQPESERKKPKGLNTPGLFLYKTTFSISALKLTHIPLIPAGQCLRIESKRRHKPGQGAAVAHIQRLPHSR